MAKTMVPGWEKALRAFFASDLAERAGSYLKPSARIAVHVLDEHSFSYSRRKGRNHLERAQASEADVHFWVSVSTLRHLLKLAEDPDASLGAMGVAVFEHLFHSDPRKKIRVRVRASFVGLWTKGYFSVLKAGGPEVASFLAQVGYDSFSRLSDLVRHFRG